MAGAAVLLSGGAAVLLGGDDVRPSAPAADVRPSVAAPAAPTTPAPAGPSPLVVSATAPDRTPDDARMALEQLLAVRADGMLDLLRGAWEGDTGAVAPAARAVDGSSDGLAAVVTAWGGPGLAESVRAGLDQQSHASRDYAGAVAAGDGAAADRARVRMGEVSRQLGAVLDDATGGRIAAYVPPQDAAQYRAFVDALEAGDAAGAAAADAWLRARLAREGTALAAGVAEGSRS